MKKALCIFGAGLTFVCACAPFASHQIPPPIVSHQVQMVGGQIRSVNAFDSTFTITTPMGQEESLRINDKTVITRGGSRITPKDISRGDHVRINYVPQKGGWVVVEQIQVGYYVPNCSCGSGCRCPLSRGCRVVRY